jgi:hypothetical protein
MPDKRGWPDPVNPGVPPNAIREAAHLIINQYGLRCWARWTPTSDKAGGLWQYAGGNGPVADWTYIGPVVAPVGQPAG